MSHLHIAEEVQQQLELPNKREKRCLFEKYTVEDLLKKAQL